MESIEGKVALVTGSSRGIGKAVAVELARSGADVAVNYRARDDLAREVVSRIEDLGRRAIAVKADVGDASECGALVDETVEKLGSIDILVNNAGIWRPSVVEEVKQAELQRIMATNVMGAFHITGRVVRLMKEAGWGRVMNISSVIGVTGYQGDTMYAATKAAQIGFTKALAREVARYGITVNAVIPGFISTDMHGELQGEARERILKSIPLRRWGTPEEVAEVVSFLVTSGSYITGHLFAVDGGYTI